MDFDLLEKKINEFEKKTLESFDENINKKQQEIDPILYFLKSYHAYLNFVTTEIKDNLNEVDALFISKLSTDVLAIYSCLNHGVKNQSLLIIRSLLESSVTYEFIQTDRKVLLPLYEEHEHYLRGKRIKETDTSDLPDNLDTNNLMAKYQKVENNYSGNYWFSKFLKQNKGIKKPTIFDLFKLLNREDEYKEAYSTFSNFTHGSSITSQSFQSKNGYTLTFNFDKTSIHQYALLTIGSANNTLVHFPTSTQDQKDIISYSTKYFTRLKDLEI